SIPIRHQSYCEQTPLETNWDMILPKTLCHQMVRFLTPNGLNHPDTTATSSPQQLYIQPLPAQPIVVAAVLAHLIDDSNLHNRSAHALHVGQSDKNHPPPGPQDMYHVFEPMARVAAKISSFF